MKVCEREAGGAKNALWQGVNDSYSGQKNAALQKKNQWLQRFARFLRKGTKKYKVLVDRAGVNLFIWFLSGAHSASAAQAAIALKQHKLPDR
ncbi:MAG: hypothetical protein JXQ99_26300 [Hyphomicrobiaceae bacterium]